MAYITVQRISRKTVTKLYMPSVVVSFVVIFVKQFLYSHVPLCFQKLTENNIDGLDYRVRLKAT